MNLIAIDNDYINLDNVVTIEFLDKSVVFRFTGHDYILQYSGEKICKLLEAHLKSKCIHKITT